MAPPKRQTRSRAPPRQTRTRTRQNRGTLVTDPEQNTQLLNNQLRSLGLYAAPTLGDGNCLFRALSDQLYGSPSQHLKLREEICDWMAAHETRYAPFVDDERGIDVHLRCMRQPGTYGGHLELSAFAHLKRRDVKVIQPGLVYVIEWAAGGDLPPADTIAIPLVDDEDSEAEVSAALNDRDKRHKQRDRKKERKEKAKTKQRQVTRAVSPDPSSSAAEDNEDEGSRGAVYVAYHDWEHFSSVRNLTGPHAGLPSVVERPTAPGTTHPRPPSSKSKPSSKVAKVTSSTEPAPSPNVHLTPAEVPLPQSRSASPTPSTDVSGFASSSQSLLSAPLGPSALRSERSPKRSYDESSGASSTGTTNYSDMSQGSAKRTRSSIRTVRNAATDFDIDVDGDADTPSLSASGSSADSTSSLSSPAPSPPPPAITVVTTPPPSVERPLTRRQRKALGLPKQRPNVTRSPGKIVIPGGRYKKPAKGSVREGIGEDEEADESAEDVAQWSKNGTGRLDVRGFRELKI